jgi:hypothetical protein
MWGVRAEPTPQGDKTSPQSPASDAEPPTKQRRSNEFWLAVLGFISTVVAGVVGAVMTWYTGEQHDHQETMREQASFAHETMRAQTSFTRSQQLEAYTAFDTAIVEFHDSVRDEVEQYTAPYMNSDTHLGPRAKQDFATSANNLLRA